MNVSVELNAKLAAQTIINNAPTIKGCKYCAIPTSLLELDSVVQRPAKGHEHAIARNWDDSKCDDLKVNYQSETGKLTVIDGQHRLLAARERGVETLVCRVYVDLDTKQRAKLFAAQWDNARKLTIRDIFKANLIAEDSVALKMQRIAHEYGFYILPNAEEDKPIIKPLERLWGATQRFGEEPARFYFNILTESGWRDDPKGDSKTFCDAILRIWRMKEKFTSSQLAYIPILLKGTNPTELKANAVLAFPRGEIATQLFRYISYRITNDEIPTENNAVILDSIVSSL